MDTLKRLSGYITAELDYWNFSGVIRVVQNGRIPRRWSSTAWGMALQRFCTTNRINIRAGQKKSPCRRKHFKNTPEPTFLAKYRYRKRTANCI
ncbi:MAG: hypothetical protein K2K74_04760 [Lachnospiraceae bacterium]|nr:hypothetical protein [Lachnospiraceae bacterium]